MYEVEIVETFAAAHALRDYKGGVEPLHGHNFRVEVTFAGDQVDAAGMLIDFVDIGAILRQALAPLNYANLNETPPFDRVSPSAENIARHLFDAIQQGMRAHQWPVPVRLAKVKVWETEKGAGAYLP